MKPIYARIKVIRTNRPHWDEPPIEELIEIEEEDFNPETDVIVPE